MTNAEKIKNMDSEELANFLFELLTTCEETSSCEECKYCKPGICMSVYRMQMWLESEAEG